MQVQLTISQAAKYVGESTNTRSPHVSCVRRWIQRGARGTKLRATRVGGRYYVDRKDLVAFLNATPSKPEGASQASQAISELLGCAWGK